VCLLCTLALPTVHASVTQSPPCPCVHTHMPHIHAHTAHIHTRQRAQEAPMSTDVFVESLTVHSSTPPLHAPKLSLGPPRPASYTHTHTCGLHARKSCNEHLIVCCMPTVHTSTPRHACRTATQAPPHPPSYAHTCAHTRMCQRARKGTKRTYQAFVSCLLYTLAPFPVMPTSFHAAYYMRTRRCSLHRA